MKLWRGLFLSTITIFSLLVAGPVNAMEPDFEKNKVESGSILGMSGVTLEQWEEAVAQLVSSDLPRDVKETRSATEYTFFAPSADGRGTASFGIAVPKEAIQPRLGGGSDKHGPYFLLNSFDQAMLQGGYTTAFGAALCAIPAVGTIACGVIIAAGVAAAAWLNANKSCPQNLKV
ncbi:MAG: hypothetical protein ACTJHU_00265, partial [Mycetocola sp.]